MNTAEFELLDTARKILAFDPDFHELQQCLRGYHKSVQFKQHVRSKKVRPTGLNTCGRVWVCPVCSAKVSYRRALEVENYLASWRSEGKTVLSATLTIPHHHDSLQQQYPKLIQAFDKMKRPKAYATFAKTHRISHYLRRTEITCSRKHGFHAHYHVFWFVDTLESDLTNEALQAFHDALYDFWARACLKVGLGKPDADVGVQIELVDDPKKAARYVMKAGFPSTSLQESAKGGLSFWGLLRLAAEGDPWAIHRVRDYAKATMGRQSYRPSNSLGAAMGQSLTDADILKRFEDDWLVIFEPSPDERRLILRYNLVRHLLEAGERGGRNAMLEVLTKYQGQDSGSALLIYPQDADRQQGTATLRNWPKVGRSETS